MGALWKLNQRSAEIEVNSWTLCFMVDSFDKIADQEVMLKYMYMNVKEI